MRDAKLEHDGQPASSAQSQPPSGLGHFLKKIRTRSRSPVAKKRSLELLKNHDQTDRANAAHNGVNGHIGHQRSASSDKVTDTLPPRSPCHRSLTGWLKHSISAHSKDELDQNCSPSPGPFGSFVARLSGRKQQRSILSPQQKLCEQDKRGTLSEEDLISKSLVSELETTLSSAAATKDPDTSQKLVSDAMITSYRSQESVFDTPSRLPSYIRLSCALSGYRNHRPLASPTAPRFMSYRNQGIGQSPRSTPLGQSIVERRLEKFERTDDPQSTPRAPALVPELGDTPTPVRDLVKNFDKMQLRDEEEEATSPQKSPALVNGTQSYDSYTAATVSYQSGHSNATDEQAGSSLLDEVLKATEQIWVPADPVCNGQIHDGKWYELAAKEKRLELEEICAQYEALLDDGNLPESASDSIRLAAGKARLLMRKKLAKFDELVQKNLNPVSDDPRPTRLGDLEGYWALVAIELDDIENGFAAVDRARTNGWRATSPEVKSAVLKSSSPKISAKVPKSEENGEEKARKDKERREKLRQAKAAAKQRMKDQNSELSDQVQIYSR